MTNPLLARFADVPALIDPRSSARFEADLEAIIRHPRSDELMASSFIGSDDGFWFAPDDWRSAYRPYVVVDGILQIPVKGVLLYDFPWAFGSYATGYAYIARAIDRGLTDGNVRGIALIVNSYGGQGAGCFDLANRIFAARSVKPVKAYAQMAYSAGYAVACAAQVITASNTAGIGSIGVVMTHLDVSRMLDQAGLKYTFVFFGDHKVDGNSYQPLPDDVKARWQGWCDEQGAMFCNLVARNRNIDVTAVEATQAECYLASEALKLDLIDAIAPLDDAITAFTPEQSDPDDDEEGDTDMNSSVPAAGSAAAAAATALENTRAEGVTAGKLEGAKEGSSAERTRISAILSCDEAKDRTGLARHIAFDTDMTVDAAKTMLGKSAKETSAETADPLSAAMAGVKNPTVGAGGNADQSDDAKATALAGSIVTAYRGKPAAAAR